MSEAEALKNAFNEFFVVNPLEAAKAGAISGGVFGAGANVVSDIRTNIQQNPTINPQGIIQQNIQESEAVEGMRQGPDIDSNGGMGDNNTKKNSEYLANFKFKKYFMDKKGPPPADMVDPHAHQ